MLTTEAAVASLEKYAKHYEGILADDLRAVIGLLQSRTPSRDAQIAWDMENLAEALEHRGQHESEGRWGITVDISVELPMVLAALRNQ